MVGNQGAMRSTMQQPHLSARSTSRFQALSGLRCWLHVGLLCSLSSWVLTAEPLRLTRVGRLARPLAAVGSSHSAANERGVLQAAFARSDKVDDIDMAALLEAFADENPGSVWTPSLHAGLAHYWLEAGAYSRALEHWARAWELTRGYGTGPGKEVADYALAYGTRVLVGLGHLDEAAIVFAEAGNRHLDAGPLEQKYLKTLELYGMLQRTPAASYRGGWSVLDHMVNRARGKGLDPRGADRFYREGALFEGCSLKALAELALEGQCPMLAVERPDGVEDLPVPGVLHLAIGHYVALLSWEHGLIRAYDPLWGERVFRPEVLNAEASGRFLVVGSQVPAGWRPLSRDDMSMTLGRCSQAPGWFSGFSDGVENLLFGDDCGDGPSGAGSGGNAGGSNAVSRDDPTVQDGGDGYELPVADCPHGDCAGNAGTDLGLARWQVTEPNINLWLRDQPLRCQPAYGPAVGFRLYFKQRDEYSGTHPDVFSLGPGWNCNWLSWLDHSSYAQYGVLGHVKVFLPGAGMLGFYFTTGQTVATDYYYNSRLVAVMAGGSVSGYRLELPDGRQFLYAQPWGESCWNTAQSQYLYMTESVDPEGFITHYDYAVVLDQWGDEGLRLRSVGDHNNELLFTVYYTTAGSYGHLVDHVTDRFGRTTRIEYALDGAGMPHLSRITDAAGLSSAISYDASGWPRTLTTPYGTTTFSYQWFQSDYNGWRYVILEEPNGGRQMYLFTALTAATWGGQTWLPDQVPANLIPGNLPFGTMLDTLSMNTLNSFHWNQRQSTDVPVELAAMTPNHFNKARLRHWLARALGSPCPLQADAALSWERAPSLDDAGTVEGHITWYDYEGKPIGSPSERGTQILPSLIARKLPDGSTWYRAFQRNGWGHPIRKTETYGTGNPAATRTYTYTYAANGIDLTELYQPGDECLVAFTYNGQHQVLTRTVHPDALTTYVTTYTYDAFGRLAQVQRPTGLTTSYLYNAASGGYLGYLSDIADQPINRSQRFTWLNGYVRKHTDARGLARTFTRDGLYRLTQIDFPAHDGMASSSVQYSYHLQPGMGFNSSGAAIPILQRTGRKDRLGKWHWYGRDRLGRIVSVKDPLNHTTAYAYCGCGGPETITDARSKTTTIGYNNAGWKMQVTYADGTRLLYYYDALGRLAYVDDALGLRTYGYNNQGLLGSIANGFGIERSMMYNLHDQPTAVVDANGVNVTQTFDWLGRLVTRAVSGQGTEQFGYSARGLTTYTAPDGKVTRYGYDEADRRTSETTPNGENVAYLYNPAGDLLTLTDGRGKATTWTYDVEGHVKSKRYHGQSFANLEYGYDANGRLTWRKFWSSSTQNKQTLYRYDDAGNLTGIDYPDSRDIGFTYNAVNQVATMSTAGLGTTTFNYTDAGNLASEGGLWPNDTVSYAYHATSPRLRTGLTVRQPSGTWSHSFGYDAARRLRTLTGPAGLFTYGYKGSGGQWTNLGLPNLAAITNAYDTAGRLTGTWLRNSAGAILNRHLYEYNSGGRRSELTRTDGSTVAYSYDDDGQLTGAVGSGGQSPENLGYAYDAGGNLIQCMDAGWPVSYTVNSRNQVTDDGARSYAYDANGNRTSVAWNSGSLSYVYDDENQLVSVATDTSSTPAASRWMTEWVYDGQGRVRLRKEYTWTSGGTGTEVAKASLSASASSSYSGWTPAQAIDGVTADPGWHDSTYSGTGEYLRVNLGSVRTISRVSYLPRAMSANWADGSWNGVYRQYEIYVTNDGSGDPANWGTPLARGEWGWPNRQERREVYFAPTAGRYVIFRRVTAWGWFGPQDSRYADSGYPGYASANEIWVYENGGGGWRLASQTRYLYDGMRVVQERDGSNVPTVAYTRGLDLSGSLEGAGGIGGLLARSHGDSGGTWPTHSYYHADGGGNVTCLLNASQATVASYRYDPYGRTLSASGPLASANRYRFSSKEIHLNSGLYYFGYRHYDINTHRWLSRDPIEECGGFNLYAYVKSCPPHLTDAFGLWYWSNPFTWFDGGGYEGSGLGYISAADMIEGGAATIDGFIPVIDPLAAQGFYDPCDPLLKASQVIGTLWRDASLTAFGGAAFRAMTGPVAWQQANMLERWLASRMWPSAFLQSSLPTGVGILTDSVSWTFNYLHYRDMAQTTMDLLRIIW